MIFVTLGMQKFPFDRLLIALDELKRSGALDEEVFAQTGYAVYEPKEFPFARHLAEEEFRKKMEESRLVITHGGAGAITAALNAKKPVIACPRKRVFGEHVDDHQFELAKAFADKGYLLVCEDEKNLLQAICEAENYPFQEYVPAPSEIVDYIGRFIDNND